MKTNNIYIVTEGREDAALIEKLLPEDELEKIEKIKVVSAGGYSAALSMVRSFLVRNTNNFVILALDSDTTDEYELRDKMNFIEHYIGLTGKKGRYKVLLGSPEVESIFFEKKDLTERIIGKELSSTEFEFAKAKPKENLKFLLGKNYDFEKLIEVKLSGDLLGEFRTLSFSKKLLDSINQLDEKVNAA